MSYRINLCCFIYPKLYNNFKEVFTEVGRKLVGVLELCDTQRVWLSVAAFLAAAITGLISPTLGPYIKSKILKENPPLKRPAWYWWTIFICMLSVAGATGAMAAKTSVKLCDRVALTGIVCESVAGDKGASEVVVIQNQDDHEVNMDGWKICDFQCKHFYQFNNFRLAAQASVELRTIMGSDTMSTLYWNSKAAIWNDTDDTAFLIDRKGRTVDDLSCPPLLSAPRPVLFPTPSPSATPVPSPTLPVISSAECIWYLGLYKDGLYEKAQVINVVDGNTIDVNVDGQYRQVRYIGIDTPGDLETFGVQAEDWNRILVEGETVLLFPDVFVDDGENENYDDDFGRMLRYVIVDDHFVNYELLRWGFAKVSTKHPSTGCWDTFLDAQTYASDHSLGLWAFVTPTATPTLLSDSVPCDCSGLDLECNDFGSQSSAQTCYDYCVSSGFGDIFNLDDDYNDLVCESLP